MTSSSSTHSTSPPHILNMIKGQLRPANLVANIVSSLMIWLVAIILATSFSALVFQGRLSAYYEAGIGIALFSAIMISLLMALFGSATERRLATLKVRRRRF